MGLIYKKRLVLDCWGYGGGNNMDKGDEGPGAPGSQNQADGMGYGGGLGGLGPGGGMDLGLNMPDMTNLGFTSHPDSTPSGYGYGPLGPATQQGANFGNMVDIGFGPGQTGSLGQNGLGLNGLNDTGIAHDLSGLTNMSVPEAIANLNGLATSMGWSNYGKKGFMAALSLTQNPALAGIVGLLGTAFGYSQAGGRGPTGGAQPGQTGTEGEGGSMADFSLPGGFDGSGFADWLGQLTAQGAQGQGQAAPWQDSRMNLMNFDPMSGVDTAPMNFDPMSGVNPDLMSMMTNPDLFNQLTAGIQRPARTINPSADPRYGQYKNAAEQQFRTAKDSIMSNLPSGGALLQSLAGADIGKARALTDYTGTLTQDLADKQHQWGLSEMMARAGFGQAQMGAGANFAGQQLGANTQMGLGQLGANTQMNTARLGANTQMGLGQLSSDTQMSAAQLAAQTQLQAAKLGADTSTGNTNAVIDAQQQAAWNQTLTELGVALADMDWGSLFG